MASLIVKKDSAQHAFLMWAWMLEHEGSIAVTSWINRPSGYTEFFVEPHRVLTKVRPCGSDKIELVRLFYEFVASNGVANPRTVASVAVDEFLLYDPRCVARLHQTALAQTEDRRIVLINPVAWAPVTLQALEISQ